MSTNSESCVFVESPSDGILYSVGAWVEDTKFPELDSTSSIDEALALARAEKAARATRTKHQRPVPLDKNRGTQLEQGSSQSHNHVKTDLVNRSKQESVAGLRVASIPLEHSPEAKVSHSVSDEIHVKF